MEVVRRALQQQLREPHPQPVRGPETFHFETDREATVLWRRIMVRLFVASSAALWQGILLQLCALPSKRPVVQDETSSSTSASTTAATQKVYISKAELLSRPVLRDSTACNLMIKEECPHNFVQCRGRKDKHGRIFWFTCRTCPTRWPRAANEDLAP